MSRAETNKKLTGQNHIEPEMIDAAFDFWYSDREHLRSPFPYYIRENLRADATGKFLKWCGQISENAKEEITDEILAEKLEEIIFEHALGMVLTEDERLTIRYPFMLRIGDAIFDKGAEGKGESRVVDRWYEKRGDTAFMKIKLKNTLTEEKKETEFELPE